VAGGKVDNQKLAEEQTKQLAEINRKLKTHFLSIRPIPNSTNVSGREFATTLPGTLASLGAAASAASVGLPPQFTFSFTAQIPKTSFAPGSLQLLSVQLGEVKAICDILFAARINFLASIRREKVSPDDEVGSVSDYLELKSVVTDLATVSPYEVTFSCFASELVTVLAGFANSPNCFVVHSMTVEPATEAAMATVGTSIDVMGAGNRLQRGYPTTATVATVTPPNKGGMVTILDERQIKVTLMLEIVKLKP
jgi:hypothetical protein